MNINQAIVETEKTHLQNSQAEHTPIKQLVEQVSKLTSSHPPAVPSTPGQPHRPDFPPLSYAGAAAQSSFSPLASTTISPSPSNHAIVIRPAPGSNPSEMRSAVQRALNPRQTGLQIQGIQTTDKGDLIIRTPTAQVHHTIQEKLTSDTRIQVTPLGKREPLVAVYGVPTNLTPAELTTAVHNQNFPEIATAEFQQQFKPKFKCGPRNRELEHWAVAVTPELRNTLRSMERIYVDYRTAQVEDFLSVPKCHQCAGLGHHAEKCSAPPVCLKCGSSSHREPHCKSPPTCIPCTRRGQTCNNIGTECVSYQLALKSLIARTSYG